MSSNSWSSARNPVPRGTVVGYFASGEDAHHAISELLGEGFKASEIGAAFHSNVQRHSSPTARDIPVRSTVGSGSTIAGVASGTSAVTPSGLSTGAGTGIAGASRPGPIPGGEIPANLPTEIPSELPSEGDRRSVSDLRPASGNIRATEGIHEAGDNKSWRSKLGHIFGSESANIADRRETGSRKGSQNYGTGEGHLGDISNYDYEYSGLAFEQSFSGMGIPQEHARRLSQELRRGGAVVTVTAGSMNTNAEAILERNHGVIRYESASPTGEDFREGGNQNARVEIFGEVYRVYPDNLPERNAQKRKAS